MYVSILKQHMSIMAFDSICFVHRWWIRQATTTGRSASTTTATRIQMSDPGKIVVEETVNSGSARWCSKDNGRICENFEKWNGQFEKSETKQKQKSSSGRVKKNDLFSYIDDCSHLWRTKKPNKTEIPVQWKIFEGLNW